MWMEVMSVKLSTGYGWRLWPFACQEMSRYLQQSAKKLHCSNPFLLTLVARPHQMNRLNRLDRRMHATVWYDWIKFNYSVLNRILWYCTTHRIYPPEPPKPLRTRRLRRPAALTAPFKVHKPSRAVAWQRHLSFFCSVQLEVLYGMPFLLEPIRPMFRKMQRPNQLLFCGLTLENNNRKLSKLSLVCAQEIHSNFRRFDVHSLHNAQLIPAVWKMWASESDLAISASRKPRECIPILRIPTRLFKTS